MVCLLRPISAKIEYCKQEISEVVPQLSPPTPIQMAGQKRSVSLFLNKNLLQPSDVYSASIKVF